MSAAARAVVMGPRRIQVLTLVASGLTNDQIGSRLGISPITVAYHLQVIYQAIGAYDRAHAVALGARYGYLNPALIEPKPTRKEVAA